MFITNANMIEVNLENDDFASNKDIRVIPDECIGNEEYANSTPYQRILGNILFAVYFEAKVDKETNTRYIVCNRFIRVSIDDYILSPAFVKLAVKSVRGQQFKLKDSIDTISTIPCTGICNADSDNYLLNIDQLEKTYGWKFTIPTERPVKIDVYDCDMHKIKTEYINDIYKNRSDYHSLIIRAYDVFTRYTKK